MNENDAVAGRDIQRENIFIVDHLEKKKVKFFPPTIVLFVAPNYLSSLAV